MKPAVCRWAVASLVFVALSGAARAVPSNAQVIKDLKSPGVLSVKLVGNGRRVWNTATSQYVWDRTAIVVRKASIPEFPNARLEIGGIASYSIVGGSFPFRKFLVGYNRYTGIPAPSAQTVLKLVNADLPEFLGDYYMRSSVGTIEPIALASEPKWNWHTPNSVSLLLTSGITQKVSDTQLEKKKIVMEVRLYRDAIKKPWNRFGSSRASETSSGKITRGEDEIAAMKSLHTVALERSAKARLASLPDVQIPAFKSDLEMFAFLHQTLREGGAAKTEAVLRRLLAPRYFVKGSDVLLDDIGENLIESALREAFKGKSTYAEQYGPTPNIEDYSANSITFINADGKHRSSMQLEPSGGTWQNGVKVGETLKISQFGLGINENADEIARLRSIAPATRFALPAGRKSFAELGTQVVEQKKTQEQVAQVKAIQWTPFTSANARLKVSFPGTPTETEGKMNDKYPMWTVEGSNDLVLCRAIAIIYPSRLNRMQAQTMVDSALQSLAKNNNMTMQQPAEVNEGTYSKMATLQKDGVVLKARVFAQGNMLYQLVMSASPATMATVGERDFFGSFQALR
ncbi:MAG TPA: hypothetical protein VF681_04670 [Abditibacteriaceae bacterium]|jgi:hypothetical protein